MHVRVAVMADPAETSAVQPAVAAVEYVNVEEQAALQSGDAPAAPDAADPAVLASASSSADGPEPVDDAALAKRTYRPRSASTRVS